NQLRLGKSCRIETSRLAVCPASQSLGRDIVGIDIRRNPGGGHGETELGRAGTKRDSTDFYRRQIRRRQLALRRRLQEAKARLSIFVGPERHEVSVRRKLEILDVPGDRSRENLGGLGF